LRRVSARAAPEDGRAALALGGLLPDAPAEPSDTWRERAREASAALDAFITAAPADPNTGQAGRLRSWAIALGGDHDTAIEAAASSVGLQDRAANELLRRLATLAVVREDLPAARAALLGAHRAMPQDSVVLSDLGAVELALGQPESAAERFARVLGRHPDDLNARRDLAGALVAAGRPESAVEILTRAARAHPGVLALWLELSHAAREAAEPAIAERAARSAVDLTQAGDGRAHTALGFALAALDRRDEARSAFEEALRRDEREFRASQGLSALSRPESSSPAALLSAP